MNTDQLITILAREAGPAPRAAVMRRLSPVIFSGLLSAVAFVFFFFKLQSPAFFATPTPWLKFLYVVLMATTAAWLVSQLARPVARLSLPQTAMLGVLLTALTFSTFSLSQMPQDTRNATLSFEIFLHCATRVVAISLPAFALVFWAIRKLAPTHLRAAGAAAGLLAGSIGSIAYTLACPEIASSGVLWYTLSMSFTALMGFLLGPRALRW